MFPKEFFIVPEEVFCLGKGWLCELSEPIPIRSARKIDNAPERKSFRDVAYALKDSNRFSKISTRPL